MGWGDEIMVTGEARRLQSVNPARVAVMDPRGYRTARWHEIWEHNPRIASQDEVRRLKGAVQWLENCGGRRPYIDYAESNHQRWTWLPYEPVPGEIVLTVDEKGFAARHCDMVVIEPSVKSANQVNKDWGWSHWLALTDLMPHLPWVQIGPPGIRMLPRARHLVTRTTRLAAAAISQARAVVTHEGGLHHCAAAFGRPTVVIRGGFISPKVTGYAGQVDFYVEDKAWPLGCGMRVACQHCRSAMDSITPEKVAAALVTMLKAKE